MKFNDTVKLINNIIRHPKTELIRKEPKRRKKFRATFLTAAQALVIDTALRNTYHFPKELVYADFRTNASKALIARLDMFGIERLRRLIRPEDLAEFDALYPSGLKEKLYSRPKPYVFPTKYEVYPVEKYTGQLRHCVVNGNWFVSKSDLLRHSIRILSRYKPFQLFEGEDKVHILELFCIAGYITDEELEEHLYGGLDMKIFVKFSPLRPRHWDKNTPGIETIRGELRVFLLKDGMLEESYLDKLVACVPGMRYAGEEDFPEYALGTEKTRAHKYAVSENIYGTKAYQLKEQRDKEASQKEWNSLSAEEQQRRTDAYWSEDYDNGIDF